MQAQFKHFSSSGIIEFDKSVNMYALIKKRINDNNGSFMQQAFDSYKKTKPQFKVYKSTLIFANSKTLFKPTEAKSSGNFIEDSPMAEQNNIIYNDVQSGNSISQKKYLKKRFC